MRKRAWVWSGLVVGLVGASGRLLLAQGVSPWVTAVNNLQTAFTGPIAPGSFSASAWRWARPTSSPGCSDRCADEGSGTATRS